MRQSRRTPSGSSSRILWECVRDVDVEAIEGDYLKWDVENDNRAFILNLKAVATRKKPMQVKT